MARIVTSTYRYMPRPKRKERKLGAGVPRKLAILLGLLPSPALADSTVLKCDFSNMQGLYFTLYDDGTSARIGNGPEVGDRGFVVRDTRSGAEVIIEENLDGVPHTFTTISPDMDAVHSRALIGPDGRVLSPSQGVGRCSQIHRG